MELSGFGLGCIFIYLIDETRNIEMKNKATLKCFDCGKRHDITHGMETMRKVLRYANGSVGVVAYVCKLDCCSEKKGKK